MPDPGFLFGICNLIRDFDFSTFTLKFFKTTNAAKISCAKILRQDNALLDAKLVRKANFPNIDCHAPEWEKPASTN
jgi:hypothetical protein